MYKLTVFDLLITIATLVLVEFPRRYTPPHQQNICRLMCRGRCVVLWLYPFACVRVRMVADNWSNALVQKLGRQEFVVPSNVLVLVYGQTVVWTGALFCPLLPLINTVKFIILFYCKKVSMSPRQRNVTRKTVLFCVTKTALVYPQVTLFYNCRPALRTFRSTTSTFFFLVVLLFGWGLATTVMVYSVAAWASFSF